ncbi:unnamed protein product [Sphagnum balticum]
MDFLKEAAKLAQQHSKPQGGGGTSSDGGDYDGALPHPHTTMFSQHATTVSHAGGPGGTAAHTKPSTTELYSSAQVIYQAAAGRGKQGGIDEGKVAGAAESLLEGLSSYGGLDKSPYGNYIEKAETYLHGYAQKHGGGQAAPLTSTPGAAMQEPTFPDQHRVPQASVHAAGAGAYTNQAPSYSSEAGGYGHQGPSYPGEAGGYGPQGPSYPGGAGGYGPQGPSYPGGAGGYGPQGPSYPAGAGGYGPQGPSYPGGAGGYGSQGPSYPGEAGGYANQGPSYTGDPGSNYTPQGSYASEGRPHGYQGPAHRGEEAPGHTKPSWYE